jgi:hypothetical protein
MQRFLDTLVVISIILGIMLAFNSWHYKKNFSDEHITEMFEPITSRYGLKIVYKIGEDFFSPLENPPIPAGPPKYSKVRPIRHRVLLRYPILLHKAFDKYPVEVIKKYLNTIYFVREIDADGLKAGGTYDPFRRIIYIADNGAQNDKQAMSTFHHEFSSLLLTSHSFWVDPWTNHHPKDFKYLDDIYDDWKTMKKVRKTITDHKCYEKGVVSNYGLTNFENDFNEYSEMIFTYPEKFKKIMNKYPRIRGKFKVWLEFYQKIDPIFTEEYLLEEEENETKS